MNMNQASAPPYLAYYGMTREPFGSEIENDLFYAEPNRKQRLDILIHLTQSSNEIIKVTGPQGSGKTTLLYKFRQQAPDNWQLASIDADGGLDERQFLQKLYHQLDLDFQAATRNDLHKNLQHHFASLERSAHQAVILIDNAEQLHVVTLMNILAMLMEHDANNKAPFHLILFGTRDIEALFNEPQLTDYVQLPQRTIDLPPFDRKHTAQYIQHRLSAANFSSGKPFSDSVLRQIHKRSKGWPGQINQLAHEVLCKSAPSRLSGSASRLLFSHPLRNSLIVLSLAGVIAVLLFQDEINTWFAPGNSAKQSSTIVTENLPIPLGSINQDTVDRSDPLNREGPQTNMETMSTDTNRAPMLDEPSDESVAVAVTPSQEVTENPSPQATNTEDRQAADSPEILLEPAPSPDSLAESDQAAPQTSEPSTESNLLRDTATADDVPPSAVAVVPGSDPPKAETGREDATITAPGPTASGADDSNSQPPSTIPTPASSPAPAPDGPAANGTKPARVQASTATETTNQQASVELPVQRNAWFLSRAPGHYTLQLIAGKSLQTIQRYIREHGLKDSISFASLALYQTTRQGEPWYGLVLGDYADRSTATDALSRMPKSLRDSKPWIRDFQGIQSSLTTPSQ